MYVCMHVWCVCVCVCVCVVRVCGSRSESRAVRAMSIYKILTHTAPPRTPAYPPWEDDTQFKGTRGKACGYGKGKEGKEQRASGHTPVPHSATTQ